MKEKELLSKMNEMCFESLPPEALQKWLDVMEQLVKNRKDLTDLRTFTPFNQDINGWDVNYIHNDE